MTKPKPTTINEYISTFPKDIQNILEEIRAVVKAAAPEAEEAIKYDMPTYVLNGNLIHFAAFKKHIGFYSVPKGTAAFEKELSVYKAGKGSIQFPLDKPMPFHLIKKMVELRVKENNKK